MGQRLDESTLLELIGLIYQAAVDPGRWPSFLARFAEAMQAGGTMVWVHDFADHGTHLDGAGMSFSSHVRFDEAFLDSFASHYSSRNVWAQNEQALVPGRAVNSSMLYPDDRIVKTEWYNDWLRPQGYRYAIGGLVVKEDTRAVKFTSLRSPGQGEYAGDELRFYEALLPHLKHACEVHRQLALSRARERASTAALDQLPMGVWLVDERGQATFANRAAQQVATRANGLWLNAHGAPCAEVAREQNELRGLIVRAAQLSVGRARGGGGALAVRRRSSPRPIQVLVSPFVQEDRPAPSGSPRAVVFFNDPDKVAETPESMMRRLFGLTRTEAKFASALIAGQSVREYAEREQVSAETVRTHLKRVLAKTGARRQQELVRIILSGPLHFVAGGLDDGPDRRA